MSDPVRRSRPIDVAVGVSLILLLPLVLPLIALRLAAVWLGGSLFVVSGLLAWALTATIALIVQLI